MIGSLKKFPLTSKKAEQLVRSISKDSNKVMISLHAEERMYERGFDTMQMFKILRTGYVDDEPFYNAKKKNWTCKITNNVDGGRDAGVVTAIIQEETLIVITMEWEDL